MAERMPLQKVTPPQYRLLAPLKRGGKDIKAGTLFTPTANELKAFGDRFELVPTVEQLEAERQRQLDERRKALEADEAAAA